MDCQKCPSIIFILFGYIEYMPTYLYTYSKIVTNILIGFKIKLGDRGQKFQKYTRQVTLKIFGLKVRYLISSPFGRPFFAKNTNLLALTNLTSNRYSVPSGSSADLHNEARSAEFTDGMGWMDGMGRNQKSFNFLHSLWVYRQGIYLRIHVIKNCRQHSYGF